MVYRIWNYAYTNTDTILLVILDTTQSIYIFHTTIGAQLRSTSISLLIIFEYLLFEKRL